MIGDSITADGRWWQLVIAYHAMRRPHDMPTWHNCGIPGDVAAGVLQRFDDDIAVRAPTVAVVMLGMNDVDRDAYGIHRHGETWHRRRQAARAAYLFNMDRLLKRLRNAGVRRVVLCTPSPYDDTAAMVCPNLRGVGAALSTCAEQVRDLAAQYDAEVVDFHAPMRDLNARLQACDPTASCIGADRIHPQWPGHAFMAAIFLEYLGIPDAWIDHTVDVADTRDGWGMDKLRRTADGWSFAMSCGGVLSPLLALDLAGIPWLQRPVLQGHARLAIRGLAPGCWSLLVNGAMVGTWNANAWMQGIDITMQPSPWSGQGAAVLEACLAWGRIERPVRLLRMLRGWTGDQIPDLAGLRQVIAQWRRGDPSSPAWIRDMLSGAWLPDVLRVVDAEAAQPERGRADRLTAWQGIAQAARPRSFTCTLRASPESGNSLGSAMNFVTNRKAGCYDPR